ncbi:MAG: Ig-like domain-containing protein [Candidatus Promineifilaceae bacterium]|nr:Ig-like domain-containing protein [Candidatus Promineifilaceae bacterium]
MKMTLQKERRPGYLLLFMAGLLLILTLALASQATTVVSAATCGKSSNYLAVWEVQGNGHTSPYDGQRISDLRGVVTADFQRGTGGPYEVRGFFIQAHESDCDSATSDGVLVYTGSSTKSISVGDLIEIDRGDVDEYQGPSSFVWDLTVTEIVCQSGCNVSTLQSGYGLPPLEEYDPPQLDSDALAYNEAREGMLVQVTIDSTVVAPANTYNEFIMLRGTGHDRLHHDAPPHGHRIIVDGDGVAAANCGQGGFGYIKTFDTVNYDPASGNAVYGPLNYNFNTYKVQQDDDTYCVGHTAGNDSSYDPVDNPAPAADANILTVASFNAWNFFDTNDDASKNEPVPTQEEYDLKSLKRAAAICNTSGLNLPLIVGLQEVENDTVLQKLAGDISATCGVTYNYHTLAGPDDRSIEVAFLTRADRVSVLAYNDRQGCSATDWGITYESGDHAPDVNCDGSTPYYLHSRPPLHLEAQVELGGATRTLHVINNHFKSKLSNSTCTQSDCTDWRVEEAQHVDSLVDSILAADAGAYVMVMGDLNDYYNSDPLDILDPTHGVLTNTWDDLQGPPSSGQGTITRYSYIYNGVSQSLDHMLISDALNNLPRTVSPRHLNADWPGSHANDTSMFRSSDHDLLLVGYDFTNAGGGDTTDSPPAVTITNPAEGSTVSGSVSVTADATDDNGVSQVEFFVDGASIGIDSDGSDGWVASWDTTLYADGGHTVSATATDSAGQTASDSVSVTVDNSGGSSSTMHVADLDGNSIGNGGTWTAEVSILIVDSSGSPVADATVSGSWSNGASGSASCTTDTTGWCTVSLSGIYKRTSSVTFTVDGVTHAALTYDATANSDPDGDSDGTTITVYKP